MQLISYPVRAYPSLRRLLFGYIPGFRVRKTAYSYCLIGTFPPPSQVDRTNKNHNQLMKTVILLSFTLSLLLLTTAFAQTPSLPDTAKKVVQGMELFKVDLDQTATTEVISPDQIEFLLITQKTSANPTKTSFDLKIFDRSASGNLKSNILTNEQTGIWNRLTGTTATLSCQILRDDTNQMAILQFVDNSINFWQITQFPGTYATKDQTFYKQNVRVTEGCNRFRFDQQIYSFDSTSQPQFTPITFPEGTKIQESSPDLNYVIGDSQIFKFNSQSKSYTLVKTPTLVQHQTYKMFSNKNAFVLLGMTTKTTQPITDFTLTVLFDNGTSIQQLEAFSDSYKGSSSLWCLTSPNLTKFMTEYIKPNANSKTILVRSLNFVAMTSTPITFQNLQHYIQISTNVLPNQMVLSDNYFYIRKSLSTPPIEACYQFVSANLVQIRESKLHQATVNNWEKSWIESTSKNQMVVISAFKTTNEFQLFDFNLGNLSSNLNPLKPPYLTLTLPTNPTDTVTKDAPSWRSAAVTDNAGVQTTTFTFLEVDPKSESHLAQNRISITGDYSIVAENQRCKLIQATSSFLTLLKTGSAGYRIFGDASSALTGYTTGDISVSSGCELIQVAGLVYLMTLSTDGIVSYGIVKQPMIPAENVFKPVLNKNLTVGVFDGSLWGFSDQNKNYTRLLNDTFLPKLQVWAVPGKVIVFSVSSTGNPFSASLNAYGASGPNGQFKRFFNLSQDFIGSRPQIFVSPNLTQVLLRGVFGNPTVSAADVRGFNLDFPQMKFIENTLPKDQLIETSSITIDVSLLDDYVYAREFKTPQVKEQVFSFIFGTTLPIYKATVSLSAGAIAAYVRTVVGIDPSNNKNLLIFTETVNGADRVVNLKEISPKAAPSSPTNGGSVIEDGKEIRCSPGCNTCSSSKVCTACNYGFVLNTVLASCSLCGPQCQKCDSATECTACFNGNFLIDGQCQPCKLSCATCSNADTCTSCPPRTVLNSTFLCENITIPNCVTSSGGLCTACANGYAVTNPAGACRQCSSKCGACDPTNINLCTGCGPNMQLISGTCKRCPNKCQVCSSGSCVTCVPGFTAINGECYPNCKPSCQACQNGQPNTCTSCYGSATLVNGKCVQDPTCSTYLNCTNCNLGFVLVLGACFKCNTADVNCIQCSSDNTQQCIQCAPRYYIDPTSYSCIACPSICSSCLSSTSCTSCSDGYTLLQGSTASTCYACTSNCSTCAGSTENCLSCVTGYNLNGCKCQSASNVAYAIVLNIIVATAMNNIETIVQDLATGANITDKGDILINNIATASTLISGTIASSDPTATAAALVVSSSGPGATFGGYPLLSATFVSSIQTPPESKTQILPIILGVVLPLVAIIIGVVVYFKCIRKPINPSDNSAVAYPVAHSNQKSQFELVNYSHDVSTIGIKIQPGQSVNLKEIEA